jgi:glycosyltransferase involved in cell wall biosynthesis
MKRLDYVLHVADHVLVENSELQAIPAAHHTSSEVMCGPVDISRYRPRTDAERATPGDGKLTICWTGSPSTYQYLEPVLPRIDEASERLGGARLILMGAPRVAYRPHSLEIAEYEWTTETEPVLMREAHVGLFPLPDTAFTRARGGGKLLLYLACGLPVIASPTGIALQILEAGRTALFAADGEEWTAAVETLGSDAELQAKMSKTARQAAEARYSYDAYLSAFLEMTL